MTATGDIAIDDWRTPDTEALFDAIVTLGNRDEAARFLRDLCTHRELETLGQRWAVARLLERGLPYREIASETGASTATVTRVSHWLQHGMGGYALALQRFDEEGPR